MVSYGVEINDVLAAAEELAQEGISLRVFDLHTIKPIDQDAILTAARECGCIVTAEEHQTAGGLYSAVAEVIVQGQPVPMENVSVRDTFGQSGPPEALMDAYDLNAKGIAAAVRKVLERKG
jgi:transketolase